MEETFVSEAEISDSYATIGDLYESPISVRNLRDQGRISQTSSTMELIEEASKGEAIYVNQAYITETEEMTLWWGKE